MVVRLVDGALLNRPVLSYDELKCVHVIGDCIGNIASGLPSDFVLSQTYELQVDMLYPSMLSGGSVDHMLDIMSV